MIYMILLREEMTRGGSDVIDESQVDVGAGVWTRGGYLGSDT